MGVRSLPKSAGIFKREGGRKLDLKHLSPDGTSKNAGPQTGFKPCRKRKSNEQLSRPERMALSRPPCRLHCLSSHQTCPPMASSGFLAGAKMVAQWRVSFLQKEVVFEMEPRQGLNG